MKIGSLFSGYGGLDMGVEAVLGGSVAWVSDIDKGSCKLLEHRFPGVPNLGDIAEVNWSTVEPVDVLTGGFPCQDVSTAGMRAGLRPNTRTGLWSQMAFAISQLRPALVVAENVRGLLSAPAHSDMEPCPWCLGEESDGALRALGAVLGDLAELGYDASWHGIRAADVGACHGRFRVFLTAYPHGQGLERRLDWSARAVQSGPWRDAASVRRAALGGSSSPALILLPTPKATNNENAQTGGRYGANLGQVLGVADLNGVLLPPGAAPLTPGASEWGSYAPAIERWQDVLGRPAPRPTQASRTGSPQLSPAFVEWMMGLPGGWITETPGLSRTEMLKLCGNGVVPQQAEAALRALLTSQEVAA